MNDLIYVQWPHGGWLVWNWQTSRWDHVAVRPARSSLEEKK